MIFTDIQKEQWYSIGDHYIGSSFGRVYSFRKHDFIVFGFNAYGYLMAKLSHKGKYKTFLQHRIIGIGFIPNPNKKLTINHINGIKTDNRVDNLEWATPKENVHHAWKTGLCDNQKVLRLKCEFCNVDFNRSLRLVNSHINRNIKGNFCNKSCRIKYKMANKI